MVITIGKDICLDVPQSFSKMFSDDIIPNSVQNINTDDQDREIILQPLIHFNRSGITDLQTNLWLAFNYWFKVQDVELNETSKLLHEMVHILEVGDDVIDNSVIRYGIPTVHLIYGRCRTIYSIVYSLAMVVDKIANFSTHEFTDDFIKSGLHTSYAQGVELYFQDAVKCPTEEEYFENAANKIAPYLECGMKVLQIFSRNKQNVNLQNFTKKLGIYLQVYNDYICFKSSSYQNVKKFGEDMTEGKFSFPIIHAIRTHPEDTQIMDILKQRTSDFEVKKYFVGLLEKFGSLKYTANMLTKLKKECFEEMDKSFNPEMKELLDFALDSIDTLLM